MKSRIVAACLALLIGSMSIAGCADRDPVLEQQPDTILEPIPEEEMERIQEEASKEAQAQAEEPEAMPGGKDDVYSSVEEFNSAEEESAEGESSDGQEKEPEEGKEQEETGAEGQQASDTSSTQGGSSSSQGWSEFVTSVEWTGTPPGAGGDSAAAAPSGAAQPVTLEEAPTWEELKKLFAITVDDGYTADQLVTLGLQYQDGIGVPQWYAMADACFEKAMGMGSQEAATALATIRAYKSGSTSEELSPSGYGWMQDFYNQGAAKKAAGDLAGAYAAFHDDVFYFEDPFVRGLTGMAEYLTAEGTAEDVRKGLAIYRYIGQRQGIGSGYTALGKIYQAPGGTYQGIDQSMDRAVACFEKSFGDTAGLVLQDGEGARLLGNLLARGYITDGGSIAGIDMTRAAQAYASAAGLGDREAAYRLSGLYGAGDGVEKDDEKAASFLVQALTGISGSDQWIAEAYNALGIRYETGKGLAKDLDAAQSSYKNAFDTAQAALAALAAGSDKEELEELVTAAQEGLVRMDQRPLSRSDLQKLLAVRPATKGVSAEELMKRGDAYLNGTNVPLWYSMSMAYYEAAKKAGAPQAQEALNGLEALRADATSLANNMLDGTGVLNDVYQAGLTALKEGNYLQAYARFHDLFSFFGDTQDRSLAQFANMVRDGMGTDRNPELAYQLLLFEAAEKGVGEGFYRISELYSAPTGTYKGFQASPEKALWFARRSFQDPGLESRSVMGAYTAGCYYDAGYVSDAGAAVAPDYKKAKECFEAAASGTEDYAADAWYQLGRYYEEGRTDVPQDYEKAFSYYEKYYEEATKDGYISLNYAYLPQTSLALARLCEAGLGTDQDVEKAKQYYVTARDLSTGRDDLMTINATAIDALLRLSSLENQNGQ